MSNPIKTIEELIKYICHDTYFLTRDDIDSIEWRLREVLTILNEMYQKRGKQL